MFVSYSWAKDPYVEDPNRGIRPVKKSAVEKKQGPSIDERILQKRVGMSNVSKEEKLSLQMELVNLLAEKRSYASLTEARQIIDGIYTRDPAFKYFNKCSAFSGSIGVAECKLTEGEKYSDGLGYSRGVFAFFKRMRIQRNQIREPNHGGFRLELQILDPVKHKKEIEAVEAEERRLKEPKISLVDYAETIQFIALLLIRTEEYKSNPEEIEKLIKDYRLDPGIEKDMLRMLRAVVKEEDPTWLFEDEKSE